MSHAEYAELWEAQSDEINVQQVLRFLRILREKKSLRVFLFPKLRPLNTDFFRIENRVFAFFFLLLV